MPGISGIIMQNGGNEAAGYAARMANSLLRKSWQTIHIEQADPGALASVAIDQERRIARRDGMILAYAGEIVGHDDLRQAAGPVAPATKYGERVKGNPAGPEAPLADALLTLYQNRGARALCGLNGLYVIAIWDGPARKLHLINDRYGIQKLYYWQAGEQFAFSSEMKAIARLPGFRRAVSSQAVVDLMCLGFVLDERTLFEEIHLLPPASLATFEHGRLHIETYWKTSFDRTDIKNLPERQMVSDVGDLTLQAVRRRMHPDTALFLTGGLDSRLVAGMYHKNQPDYPVHAVSLGHLQAKDVQAGQQLAETLDLDFHFVPLDASYLPAYARACVQQTEGNMNIHASWIMAANDLLRSLNVHYALTGIGGEATSGRHILLESLQRDPYRGLEMYFAREDFVPVARLLRPELRDPLIAESKASFVRALENAPVEDPLNRLDYVGYYQSLRRHATSVDVFADTVHPLDPLLDNDLIDYIQGIPPEMRARAYIYRKMIRQCLPNTVSIGDALSGPILKPYMDRRYAGWQSLYRRLRRRATRMVKKTHKTHADKPEGYIMPNTWLRTGAREFTASLMAHTEYLEDLFDISAVDQLFDDHMSGRRNEYRTLCGLMTVILFHQELVDGAYRPHPEQQAEMSSRGSAYQPESGSIPGEA